MADTASSPPKRQRIRGPAAAAAAASSAVPMSPRKPLGQPPTPLTEGDLRTAIAWWKGRHVLSVSQFKRSHLAAVCHVANQMREVVELQGKCELLRGKVLANVFFEPSTRTACSFHAAMLRLGGDVIQISASSSSAKKGETLQDTIRCLECYTDVVVLRHPEKGSAATAAAALQHAPLLNAGDGPGEHPTQALLDFYTIFSEFNGHIEPLTVTMVGDLKYGRTVHSLAQLLALYNVRLHYVSPEQLKMPQYIVDKVAAAGVPQNATADLDKVLPETDVLYVTRIQKERFPSQEEYLKHKGAYIISNKTMATAKPKMIVMHPLPRVGEILEEVDSDPRAAYFRQMRNGMLTRMALLALVTGCAAPPLKLKPVV